VDRGCLVCTLPDSSKKKIPIEDVLILIIAARGISFSNDALSSLMKQKATVMHCDETYKPIGITVGIPHLIHKTIFSKQIEKDEKFNRALWKHILSGKVSSQINLLQQISSGNILQSDIISIENEGIIQKIYWKHFFSRLKKDSPKIREHQQAQHPVNQILNYGYAVLNAIVHRSIIAHGLNPLLGIHHRYHFKSYPLVYDLMEPLRPFCDAAAYRFYSDEETEKDIKIWAKFIVETLVNKKIKHRNKKIKLLYAIDFYISSVADCFYQNKVKKPFIPELTSEFLKDE